MIAHTRKSWRLFMLALVGAALWGASWETQAIAQTPHVPAPGVARPTPDSVTVASASSLWPKVNGVATVYYVIDSASDPSATSNIQSAISTFNADFPNIIQWVTWNSSDGPNYVDINLNADDSSGECEANEGYEAVPAQPMGGSGTCTVTTILHEMGHVIGLWHEQSRTDRNSYITVNYGNVIKGSWSNFEIITQNQQLLTPYDYASLMQYPSYSFSRNGGPVIETIPAGIPLQGVDGAPVDTPDYSAADKEAIERLYGAAPTAITITSNPVGLEVVVDGATVTTPQTYAWAINSQHTLSVPTGVQTLTGDIANSTTSATFYYTYGRWNDSTGDTHTIIVAPGNGSPAFPTTSPQVATYSANFIQLVPYTSSVYPSGAGTASISPQPQSYTGATGSFFVARQQATLTASPASGWNFYEFNNAPFWLSGGLGANPKTFYVPDTGNPVDTTVEFSNTPIYTVGVSPDAFSSNLYVYVDGNFAYTPKNFSSYYDSSWTFGSSHTLNLDPPEYPYSSNSRYAFSSWSDGGAQSHTIASLPAASTSYIATLTPQFAPATNFNYPPCGGSGALSPNSPTNDGFYPSGQSLQYGETPDTGWSFAGWTYDLTGTSSPASLTATDETLVFANFNTTTTPLTLTGLSPSSISAGSANFTLTLTGSGFTASSLVSVNGVYRTVTYVSSTELQVPLTASDVATPSTMQVFVENYPSGWTGCAVFGYQTFIVDGAAQPSVSLSTTSIAFPSTATGSTSTQAVTVTNTGSGNLTVTGIATTGTNPSDFSHTSNCGGTSIAPSHTCTIQISFTPATGGSFSASMQISDNASGSPQSIALTGTSPAAPAVSLSTTSINFPSTSVGSTSSQSVTVTNTGSGNLTVTGIAATGANPSDFSHTSNCGGTSITPGHSCTLQISFTPAAGGSFSASMQITDNASNSPQSIALTATSPAGAAVSLSTTSINFPSTSVGSTSTVPVTVKNTGSASLTVTKIAATGTNPSDFSHTSNCGGTAIPPNGKCTIQMTFTPEAGGTFSATMQITDNASNSPQSVSLSGTGTTAPAVSLSSTSVSFPATSPGSTATETVMLTNTGSASLTVTKIATTGSNPSDFRHASNCGGTSIAPGHSCTIQLSFTPASAGSFSAIMQITDNASDSPQSIALSGSGS
jgi:hypothetical protein